MRLAFPNVNYEFEHVQIQNLRVFAGDNHVSMNFLLSNFNQSLIDKLRFPENVHKTNKSTVKHQHNSLE